MKSISKTLFAAVWVVCHLVACGSETPTSTEAKASPRHIVQALDEPCTNPIPLGNATPLNGVGGPLKGWSCIYTLTLSEPATSLEFVTSGGSGDGDLYVKYGSAPTDTSSSSYNCRSIGGTTAERCVISSPQLGTYYVRMYGHTDFSGVTLTGTYTPLAKSGCDNIVALSNGVPVGNLSMPSTYWSCFYTLEVPAGANDLKFTMSGSGDGDLYVKFGSAPTLTSYDCRSSGMTSTESCVIPTAQAGTYHVRLWGAGGYSGASLTGSYTQECTSVTSLTPGTAAGNINGPANRWSCIYALEVPARATDLKFVTSGGTGNGDLYVRYGAVPDKNTYDCKSTGTTSSETCTLPATRAGTYYVRMTGPTAFSGINLTSTYTLGKPMGCTGTSVLSNGTPEGSIGAAANDWSCLYALEVPPGASNLRFVTSGGSGNGDMYVKRGAPPSDTSYDCKSTEATTSESCALATAQAGTWYVRMHGPTAFSGVSLTGAYSAVGPASCTSVIPLSNGSSAGSVSASAANWSCHYTLDVPAGVTDLKFVASGGSGDGDLYVKFGSAPDASTYDCKSASTSSTETCSILLAQPGTYHVRMNGYTSFSGVSLTGSYTSTVLSNNTPVNGLGVTLVGAWSSVYTLEVPPGASNLQFVTSGGTGNSDLYVKFGSPPSDTSYDCKSTGSTTSETCALPTARAGTWYARAHGATPFSGISLKGSYTPGSSPVCTGVLPLSAGTAAGNLGASAGGWSCTYALDVPAGASNLRFVTSGGSGNGDLYVKQGSVPDSSTYDCKSSGSTTSETCTFPAAAGGTWYVRVYGASAFSGVNLTGSYIPINCNVALPNGSPMSNLHAGADTWSCVYALDVPAGASNLRFATSGGLGNASMYVKHGSAPDSSTFDCKSSGVTTSETCTIPVAQAGTWYVRLYGAAAFSGVSLTGSYSTDQCTQALSNGVPVGGLYGAADTWSCTYTLEVPADVTQLRFSTGNGSGVPSLYVRHGAAPDSSTYDCKGSNGCSVPAQAGTWYVRLQTANGFSGASLTGSYIPSIKLSNGVAVGNISGPSTSAAYTLEVPAGATNLKFVTSGGTGNSDLSVRYGSASNPVACESKGTTTSETCTLSLPQAGTYFAQLSGSTYAGVSLTGSYTTTNPVPPPNDTCTTAQPLVFTHSGLAYVQGDTTLAGNGNSTADASPTCSASARASGNDVVYRLTLTEPRSLQVSVKPTDARLAPVVYLRKAENCSSPVAASELACNATEADASGPVDLFVPNLPAGEYTLWVDGGVYKNWSGPTSFGRFSLEAELNPPVLPPVNESCQTAQPLVFHHGVARAVGDTRTALNDNSQGCGNSTSLYGADVAYSYTLEEAQDVFIEVKAAETAPGWRPVASMRKGPACSSYAPDDRCLENSNEGRYYRRFVRQSPGTYIVWVDGATAKDAGPFELKVTVNTPSYNGSCSSARPLAFDAAGDAFARGDTTYADDSSATAGTSMCASQTQNGGDVVYTVTVPPGPPQQVSFVVEPTIDSWLLPVLSLRRACALSSGSDELICGTPLNYGLRQKAGIAVAKLEPGTYYLWVDSDNWDGAFSLYGHMGAPNDTCATARLVSLASDAQPAVATTNVGMTNDYGSGSANPYGGTCGNSGEATPDSVYAFTAPASGKYYTNSNAMRFLGETCDPALCSANSVFEAVEGHTYYFVLDHQGYGSSGTQDLRILPYPW
ncbi:PPC domain-containing protein [Stigmatella sp. ncwal1]|uniref:PPC domain-containing protein n=1 Tax=Stigmatella ashevillensis TaxID=2995309 RepID=A0ABT5DAT8_9BACT|nr:PPC domain-containing protein [Stigmatella ashevillena]MDC0710782.1 PPC domain-containing protein [Stigmatella ashevillena]